MKKLFLVVGLVISFLSQAQQPTGVFVKPQNNRGSIVNGIRVDKELYPPLSDTNWTPLRAGAIVYWPNSGNDTATWQYDGARWEMFEGGGNTDTLNALAYDSAHLANRNGVLAVWSVLPVINVTDYGLIGNATYNTTGDPNALSTGTYNEFPDFMPLIPNQNFSKTGGAKVFFPNGSYRFPAISTGYIVDKNNVTLEGSGIGASNLHFERTSTINETALKFGKSAGTAEERLLRGGGLRNVTLKTNNTNIINDGLAIDYAEYQTYENLNIEGFYRSAIRMGLWESYFSNITLRGIGAGQTATNGIPDYGVIDFQSHESGPYSADACNNTTFDKVTISNAYGTHIRASAAGNTIVNINVNGLYDETAHGDAGGVDTLPIYYFNGVRNFNINGGFLTVNETGVNRDRYAVVISNDARNGWVNFSNFSFNQNITSASPLYAPNATRSLKAFVYLSGSNSRITFTNCTFFDPSGSVGRNIAGPKYLIDGEDSSQVVFDNVVFEVPENSWDTTNFINPNIRYSGSVSFRYYNASAPIVGQEYSYNFVPDAPFYDSSLQAVNTGYLKRSLGKSVGYNGSRVTNYLTKWNAFGELVNSNISENGTTAQTEVPLTVVTSLGADTRVTLNQIGVVAYNILNKATTGDLVIDNGAVDVLSIDKTTGNVSIPQKLVVNTVTTGNTTDSILVKTPTGEVRKIAQDFSGIISGRYSASGTSSQTVFSFAHGLTGITSDDHSWIEAKNAEAAANHFVTLTATDFIVTFTTARTDDVLVQFDWFIKRTMQ